MPSPFPSMDPYLEKSDIWSDCHTSLITAIKRHLNTQIGPTYYATVETYSAVEELGIAKPQGISPDVTVVERWPPQRKAAIRASTVTIPDAPIIRPISDQRRLRAVRIYLTGTDELVTAIELLSPANKRGRGLETYRRKRYRLLSSHVHLVEIDLLRGGQRPGKEVNEPTLETDYVLLLNRAAENMYDRVSEIWPLALNQPFPLMPIPLLWPDPDIPLDLNVILANVYEESGYAWRIDYRQPVPSPKLRKKMVMWLREALPDVGRPQDEI